MGNYPGCQIFKTSAPIATYELFVFHLVKLSRFVIGLCSLSCAEGEKYSGHHLRVANCSTIVTDVRTVPDKADHKMERGSAVTALSVAAEGRALILHSLPAASMCCVSHGAQIREQALAISNVLSQIRSQIRIAPLWSRRGEG